MISQAYKLSVKLFLSSPVDLQEIVPVFHGWIQRQAVAEHMLIDVAAYGHVADGPGILLVAREANFFFDRMSGEAGLTYQRKLPVAGGFKERLQQAFAEAIAAATRIEEEPLLEGRAKFRADRMSLKIADRLLAPNTQETFDAALPELNGLAARLFGDGAAITPRGEARDMFEVELSGNATSLGKLAQRV